MEQISYRQAIFLMLMLMPVMGHIIIIPSLFDLSGRDSWIVLLLTFPIGLLIGIMVYRLHILNPTNNFVQMLEQAFGNIVGKILAISLFVYFLYMIIITFYGLYDYVQVVFLPNTSKWAIMITFILLVFYGVSRGSESITRTSESVIILIISLGTLIAITTSNYKDYSNLFPLFEEGSGRVISGMWLMSAVYAEIFIILMLTIRREDPKSKSLIFNIIIGLIFITYSILSTTVSGLTIFGEEQVVNMSYPPLAILRLVSIGFLNRLDIYMVFTMVIATAVRAAAYQSVLNLAIRQTFNLQKKWSIHVLISLFVLLYSGMVIKDHLQYAEIYITKLYQYSSFISIGLVGVTWIILEVKSRLKGG